MRTMRMALSRPRPRPWPGGLVVKKGSKMLIIDYPDTKENRDKIEAIRSAWKKLTGDHSVMRVTQAADVSF